MAMHRPPPKWIALGYYKDLNNAFDILKEETIKLIVEQIKISLEEAKKIMLGIWNCPILEIDWPSVLSPTSFC